MFAAEPIPEELVHALIKHLPVTSFDMHQAYIHTSECGWDSNKGIQELEKNLLLKNFQI